MTYPIPTAALDDRLGFVGTSGSGKTYCAGTAVERILAKKGRVIIADPLGVWWGLRLCADGKTTSPYDVVIFGGEHGDLPINEQAGALIGETVARMSQSAIVDLSGFGTKAAARRFMLAFLTALYRHASKEPVHLIVDEADMWAPQRLLDKEGEAAKLLGMMETIVRRGRVLGFIPWLITQRPAVLSKDVLSQVDGLVAMKLTSSQDRDAIGDWVEGQADKAQWRTLWASLPTMQVGNGIVWVPGRGVLATASFPEKATYDSSRAPKRGEKRRTASLTALDIPILREKLASVEAEAKINDPAALKAEIARLKREIAQRDAAGPAKRDPQELERAEAAGYARAMITTSGMLRNLRTAFQAVTEKVHELIDSTDVERAKHPGPVARSAPARLSPSHPTSHPHRGEEKAIGPASALTRPQRKILDSLAFWRSVGNDAPTRPMVAAVAGYAPSSGGFNNLIGGMRTAGLLDIPAAGCVALAPSGEGMINGGMSPVEAREFILSVLTAPQRKLVEAATGVPEITRDELAAATHYAASSGGFNNLIGSLCTIDIFVKPRPGSVALSDWARSVL